MNSTATFNQSYPPTPMSSLSSRRRQVFRPLSHHGMPKSPTSPGDSGNPSHRFSTNRSLMSPPLTPMSPPMSAKSFGTFIDSEPSTPAYSPRVGFSNWDSNTILLLSPASTSTPASPLEPVWEMMVPVKKGKKPSSHLKRLSMHARSISISSEIPKSVSEESQKENAPLPKARKPNADPEVKSQAGSSHSAPLEKLATKMKTILRRKTVTKEKPEKKRRGYADLERMETVHWTEM